MARGERRFRGLGPAGIIVILNIFDVGLLAPAALLGLAVCLQRRLGNAAPAMAWRRNI